MTVYLDGRDEKIRQLETALESRVVIEQAKGRLAERFQLDIDVAFALLRSAARTSRIPLRELAGNVVDNPESTPAEIALTLSRPALWQNPLPSQTE